MDLIKIGKYIAGKLGEIEKRINEKRFLRCHQSYLVNMDYIKDVAMNQLGMKYAQEGQIVYYTVDNSNYMNQYSDIPQK